LKLDLHCEGCVKKIKRAVRHFDGTISIIYYDIHNFIFLFLFNRIEKIDDDAGVEEVKADTPNNKLTVIGKVDPHKVRDKLAEKIKKKVELVSSPQPKKEAAVADKPQENKKPDEDKKPEEKKPEEKSSKQVRNFITVSSDEIETNFIAIDSELTSFSVLIKLKRLVPPRFVLTNRFNFLFSVGSKHGRFED